jgi:alpha-L-fucosidase 2
MRSRRLVALVVIGMTWEVAVAGDGATTLWYRQPARAWGEAMPVGNGRLGAMVFGGVKTDRLQFNEATLWSGGPHDYTNPDAPKHIAEARRLIFAGKPRQAEAVLADAMGRPARQQAYQPLGDLRLSFPAQGEATEYRRGLDLNEAVATVTYRADGARYTREAFASQPAGAIVVRLTCDKPGRVSFDLVLTSRQPGTVTRAQGATVRLTGRLGKRKRPPDLGAAAWTADWEGEGLSFEARARVRIDGGSIAARRGRLEVRDANAATVLLAAATSYKNHKDITADPADRAERCLAALAEKPYPKLRAEHVADHRGLFGRVKLDLGDTESSGLATDERIKAFGQRADPQLAALLFQFGRYLLIASSRPGGLPANLQGIWNDEVWPPWSSKWTVNINTQMNYWPAEVCNLSECHRPLLDFVGELSKAGRRTAEVHYGARGWLCHHNADIWLGTAPVDTAYFGTWQTGGAWLAMHLWEHFLFTGDEAYLKKAWPVLKSAAMFFLDTLVEDPRTKRLVTCPSMSPEHRHSGGTTVCAGPAIDMQILRDLLACCIRASEILKTDEPLRGTLRKTRARLGPDRVGRHGQLQEWQQDWDDPNDMHGHVSHLYGLYPSSQIGRHTPKLLAAARTSLTHRASSGRGWPGAWRVCLWARLGEGDRAWAMAAGFLAGSTTANLFNGRRLFQIDGNFGMAAGIAEMLVQSHAPSTGSGRAGEVHLLPALPTAWPAGRVEGLCARGGFVVGITWRESKLAGTEILSRRGGLCKVRYGEKVVEFQTRAGRRYRLGPAMTANEVE